MERICHDIPSFQPLHWLRGRHSQTLAGFWLPSRQEPYAARTHHVSLPDGDQIVLHDDCPEGWGLAGPVTLLLPGLCGSFQSAYMVRVAGKLKRRGVRVFRMDYRGCGTGLGLCRRPFHAGLSEDVAEALETIARLCPGSAVNLVGYSVGGNIALKLAGQNLPENVRRVLAISPPIDLSISASALNCRENRLYDLALARSLTKVTAALRPGYPRPTAPFRSLHEVNEFYLTRVWQFGNLACYYNRMSALGFLPAIQVPALIVTAADDPIVPVQSFDGLRLSPTTRLTITDEGGHLGFIGRARPADPDHRWMDWRVVDWVSGF